MQPQEHFSKFTDNIKAIRWETDQESRAPIGVGIGMTSGDGEQVAFAAPHDCRGPVEDWLGELMGHCCDMMREQLESSVTAFVELPRERWLAEYCSQLCITTSQIWWTSEVNQAFERLEQGNEAAIKDYSGQLIAGLNTYVEMVLGNLTKDMRTKLKTLITIEVHARDVVGRFIADRIEAAADFAWQSQLKYCWDEEKHDCYISISDAEFRYSYEYVGNCGRLVITALTDRCYITLTQALRLCLGGAPAGPAGTGKTETTKDLGRGLAIWVIVQNCSDQMNYKVRVVPSTETSSHQGPPCQCLHTLKNVHRRWRTSFPASPRPARGVVLTSSIGSQSKCFLSSQASMAASLTESKHRQTRLSSRRRKLH
jgi:dynein heavy chain